MSRKLEEGWLISYAEYTKQSEAPELFHLWTGLSMLSAALRRHVWLDWGHKPLFMNLYVVLVSPPGTCKKTSAMDIGLKIGRQVPGLAFESNKVTPASLVRALSSTSITVVNKTGGKGSSNGAHPVTAEQLKSMMSDAAKAEQPAQKVLLKSECSTTIASTEFSVTIGADAHNNGLLALLTDLYDCPNYWSSKTICRGEEELHNVYLSILGATTPDWLGSSIPADAIGGGFTSRILFVSQNQRRHDNPLPKLSPEEIELGKKLVNDLVHIGDLKGEICLTLDAAEFFIKWYKGRPKIDSMADTNLDERFWGYLERKPGHLLKIASLLSISFDDSLIVDVMHLEMGLQLLERLEQRMPEAFKGVGSSMARDVERIKEQLFRAGGELEYKTIAKRNYRQLNSQELSLTIQTMVEADLATDTINTNARKRLIALTPKALAQMVEANA